MARKLTLAELGDDLDLQMTCTGLAIAGAAAMLADEDVAESVRGMLALWPDEVSDHALLIGSKVAATLATMFDHSADDLGAIAAPILAEESQP